MLSFSFSDALLTWFDQHGRHDLPWQVKDNPYHVWVSEIMLQQTQVKTVLNYFDRFIGRFPTVEALGQATWDDVAPYWAGLGYYARARNLHKAATQIYEQGNSFPQTLEGWMNLPGIGRSTAGAMMSLGLRQYGVIMDGNVKRVLSRFLAIEDDLTQTANERKMWAIAESLCPETRNADYTQAIMDLGATICTPKKPLCLYCPMQKHCKAYLQGIEHLIPFKKTKKPTPTRIGHVLLFQNIEKKWLWQQRSMLGLWGGLWCLPIFEKEEDFNSIYPDLNLNVSHHDFEIQHSFTHFTWHLKVHCISVEDSVLQQKPIPSHTLWQWLSPSEAVHQGIPTAMQKLIKEAQQSIKILK